MIIKFSDVITMITVLMLTHLWLKIKGVRNLGQTSSSPKAIINIAVIQEGFFDLETNMESVYLVVPLTPFFLWGSSFSVCVGEFFPGLTITVHRDKQKH